MPDGSARPLTSRPPAARWRAHAWVFLAAWPAASLLAACLALADVPMARRGFLGSRLALLLASLLRMLPEFWLVGLILGAASCALFALAARWSRASDSGRGSRLAEPLMFLAAAAAGLGLEYPAVWRHPFLGPARRLAVGELQALAWALIASQGALAGFALGGRRGAAAYLIALAGAGAAFLGLARLEPRPASRASPQATVLLGLDSLSGVDPVPELEAAVREQGGVWHRRAVTPALFTNVFWTSILSHRAPPETGVFLVFQSPDWERAPFNVVREARARGWATWSFFSDQTTTFVGSRAGFEFDRSGPLGWRQVTTASLKDASILLAALLPRLPRLPGAGSPPNQAGTMGFGLRRELAELLSAGDPARPNLVVAHLDYLHQAQYPPLRELTPAQRRAVLRAPAHAIRDRSLEWHYPRVPGEPLGIYDWKRARLSRVVAEEIRRAGPWTPGRRRLVVLSDHGSRRGLAGRNLHHPRFHRAILGTLGLPAREPERPLSLLDIPELIGLGDPRRPGPSAAVVHHLALDREEPVRLARRVRLGLDGEISLDPEALRRLAGSRIAYDAARDAYLPSP
ncbi:MAG: hypothetical protein HY554_14840 [Elusimicrobia bacterium]|nr:hypothetical protein [Elusimicrobiota bacterium]